MRRWFVWSALSTLSLAGCSWGRFEELTENSPVVQLKRPKQINAGFGSSLQSATLDGNNFVLVSGSPGSSSAAAFDLGTAEEPMLDARYASLCQSDDEMTCYSSSSPVALPALTVAGIEPQANCFVVGVGSIVHSDGQEERGLLAECEGADGRLALSLPVPSAFDEELSDALSDSRPSVVALATDGAETAALLVGASDVQLAWLYPTTREDPLLLAPPGTADESYGRHVAVASLGDERLYAVAAPEEGHVYLFGGEAGTEPVYRGCIGGSEGFGRTLAVGRVTGGSAPELLVADASNVHVLSAENLNGLDGSDQGACSFASLPERTLLGSFGCGSTASVSGCEGSEFGAAITVADLDGDGDGEVIVGAPRMKVRKAAEAGAVLVYDLEDPEDFELAEALFLSSAEAGDLLGAALTSVRLESRDVIVAGAPGNGKTGIFYCSSLATDVTSARCQ